MNLDRDGARPTVFDMVVSASFARTGLLALLLALVAFVLPATALAAVQPDVSTDSSQPVTASQQIVAGTVNPHGQSTVYYAEYAAASSQWCIDAVPGSQSRTTAVTLPYTDSTVHDVSVAVTGLTGGTSYCVELVATNLGGTSPGLQIPFTAGLPVVTTSAADATGVQAAAVQGTVDPASQSTTYFAVYDVATSDWCMSGSGSPADQTAPVTLSNQDALPHSVTVNITGLPLQPATSYCVAIAASNASSTSAAAGPSVIGTPSVTFTTDPPVTTVSVQSTSATAVQLSGSVNPDGVSTFYYAAYDQVGSDWCQSGGAISDSTLLNTAPQTLNSQDQSAHNVTVNITNLTTGTTYCVALSSQNTPLGVSSGIQIPITVGLPTATTLGVQPPDAPTTALLDGQVGPSGQSTTYYAIYDLQSSNWCLSHGTSGAASYPTVPRPQSLPQTDSGTYNVSVDMTGLVPGTQYCAALAANNGSNGQSGSPPQTAAPPINFTAGIPPTASTASVLDQTASQSAVSGDANAEGQTTMYHVAYDTADSSWCLARSGNPTYQTADQSVNPADTNDHGVTVSIPGLQGGTTYCAAVVAANLSGSVTGTSIQFVAGMPTATASTTTLVSPSAETLVGTVTPATQATTYYVAYDSANSYWCQNGGDPTSATWTTLPVALGGAVDNVAHDVSVPLTGLTPGEGYCAELVAVNDSATNPSPALGFTPSFPFIVTTSNTDHLTDSSVNIDGTVNPADLASSYWVAYDIQDSDWCSSGGQTGSPSMATDPVSLGPVDTLNHDVAVAVNGLSAQTGYCAELIAQNETGYSSGAQVSFTTGVLPVSVTGGPVGDTGQPSVGIGSPSATSPNAATVPGTVNPGGQTTAYHTAYAPASSSFCLSRGANGQPSTTAPAALPFTDSNQHNVVTSLFGLKAGTRYCAQLLAENASGVAGSALASFTTIGSPHLRGLRLDPAKFAATKRAATTVAKLPKGSGTRVSYQDTQAGTVTFIVTQQRHGARNRHHVCGKRVKGSAGQCAYTAIVGRFTSSARAGGNRFVFTGQLGGHKLAAGSYRLEAVAADRWQLLSATLTVRFAIR